MFKKFKKQFGNNKKIKVIEVVRSFNQTKQLKQYEPVSAFASYKAELTGEETKEEIKAISEELHELAEQSVQDVVNPQKSTSRRATTLGLISRIKVLETEIKDYKDLKKHDKPF